MELSLVVIVVLFAVTAVVEARAILGGRLPRSMRQRACQGACWRRAFPASPKLELRSFLSLFAEAFAFCSKAGLKLHPDDRILAIYRAMYPSRWQADALELETLQAGLMRRFGVQLSAVWSDQLTVGALFAQVRHQQSPTRAPIANRS